MSWHGHIAFGKAISNGMVFEVGRDENPTWPELRDPALMGPLLCRQMPSMDMPSSNVWYRLVLRTDMNAHTNLGASNSNNRNPFTNSQLWRDRIREYRYVQSSQLGDRFLQKLMYDLQEGMVGASVFEADAALVVTWENMKPETSSGPQQVFAVHYFPM